MTTSWAFSMCQAHKQGSNLCSLWGDALRPCKYLAPHQIHTHTDSAPTDVCVSQYLPWRLQDSDFCNYISTAVPSQHPAIGIFAFPSCVTNLLSAGRKPSLASEIIVSTLHLETVQCWQWKLSGDFFVLRPICTVMGEIKCVCIHRHYWEWNNTSGNLLKNIIPWQLCSYPENICS